MRTVPLFGTGFPSPSPVVSNQKRTNLYLVPTREGDKGPLYLASTPGLSVFADVGPYPSRGAISVDGHIYSVHRDRLYKITPDGGATHVGSLNTSDGHVSFAWNGTQLMLVDGTDGWIFASGTLTLISDAQFPTLPKTVCFLAGRFVVNQAGTGQFYWSDLLDGTAWDALDFATAESETDNLVAVAANQGQLILFGDLTTEFWAPNPNTGNSSEAFVRVGGSGIEWGCASAPTIAQYDTGLLWLAKNKLGECRVVKLQGYTPVPLDDPEVSHAINDEDGLDEATGFSYVMDGRTFYQLNAGEHSYLYDGIGWGYASSGTDGGRHRANIRAALSERPYVFDYADGKCYLLDKDALTDAGATIAREVVTRALLSEFNPITVWQLYVDVESGMGSTTEVPRDSPNDPITYAGAEMMMQYSRDNGRTWSDESWANMGAVGEYLSRCVWRSLGRGRDFTFKFRVTDEVRLTITAAAARVQ